MTWFTWLGLALVIVVVAAMTGIVPRGGRPVANTKLIAVARVVLVLVVIGIVYLAYRGR